VGGTQNHYAILSKSRTRYRVIRTDLKSIQVHLTELFKLLYLNGQSIQVIKHDVIGLREQSWITLLENKNAFFISSICIGPYNVIMQNTHFLRNKVKKSNEHNYSSGFPDH